MSNSLKHIAIIMDGNKRWAKKNQVAVIVGHQMGLQTAKKIINYTLKVKIPYLTLFAFSSENWQRDQIEVNYLMELLKDYLTNEIENLHNKGIKLSIIGDYTKFDPEIIKKIIDCQDKTKNNKNLHLQIAIGYGARDEIIMAQKKLFIDLISAKLKIENVDKLVFKDYLYTKDIPDPDLLIRTSGEQRVSNFLLWQIAYTELYFTKILWPDFKPNNFKRAIENFFQRERRYGKS